MVLLMASTSLISFWYIDKFSKVIDHLGVRTNSAVIKLYVITWVGLVITDIILHTMRVLSSKSSSDKITMKLRIVYTSGFAVQWVFTMMLDSLLLYSYSRLETKLSEEA